MFTSCLASMLLVLVTVLCRAQPKCVQPQIDESVFSTRCSARMEDGNNIKGATHFQHPLAFLGTRLVSTSIGRKSDIIHKAKPRETFPRPTPRSGARGTGKARHWPGGRGPQFGVSSAYASCTVQIFAIHPSRPPLA